MKPGKTFQSPLSSTLDQILDNLEERNYIVVRKCKFGLICSNPLKDWEARELWERRPKTHEYHISFKEAPQIALYPHDLQLLGPGSDGYAELIDTLMKRFGWIYKKITWEKDVDE